MFYNYLVGGNGCSYAGEKEIFPIMVEEEEREREREGMLGSRANIGLIGFWIFLLNLNRVGELGGFYLLLIGYDIYILLVNETKCHFN